ncbi:MAG: SDR family oxidoreductase [Phycisphaerales bacterium]|nr:SDR family oxidoreductase [Phycisphaerales bacterium]
MLNGKTAFVTGGTGAVGRAIVCSLAAAGASVGFSYRSHGDKAREIENQLADSPGAVKGYELDVLDARGAREVCKAFESELGPIDILINNAGISQVMPFALIEEQDWDSVMDVNVKGMFLTTKAFLRGMIARKSGNIINMGSLAGSRVLEVPVHYATSKSAVIGFTLSLAGELARYNIRVNAVAPGMLDGGVGMNVPEKQRREYCNYCTQGRPGRPEEAAALVTFLASDASSYINAQVINVDGGI